MQIDALDRNYRRLTKAGATRVAEKFGLLGREHELLKIVDAMTDSFELYVTLPVAKQQKSALSKLSKALGKVALVASEHHRELEGPLFGSLLGLLGELLTYEGMEQLLKKPVTRKPGRPPDQGEEYSDWSMLDRSIKAAQAGPQLLVSLLEHMKNSIDYELRKRQANVGGRPANTSIAT